MEHNVSYLNKIGKQSVVDKVVNQLVDAIISGNLRPGDRIPTEMELSETFNIGRNSVREAIKVLVSYGILEIRRAEGTFVCSGFTESMLNPMLYGIILEQDSSEHLAALRRILETGTLQLAVEKATEDDIQRLKVILDAFVDAVSSGDDVARVAELDFRFHQAVEEATHNPLLIKVSSIVDNLTKSSQFRTNKKVLAMGEGQHLIDTHVDIFNTVVNRDRDSVLRVLDNSYKHWTLIVGDHTE